MASIKNFIATFFPYCHPYLAIISIFFYGGCILSLSGRMTANMIIPPYPHPHKGSGIAGAGDL